MKLHAHEVRQLLWTWYSAATLHRGTQHLMDKKKNPAGSVDLLHGPILRSLIIFMLPVFISNIFQQFYNVADTALVGNYLGENALAAVGSVSSIFEFLVFFSQSLGVGLSIVVGREFGRGDMDRLKRAVAGSIVVGAVVCIVLTTLAILGMKPFLHLIKTPEEVFLYLKSLKNPMPYFRRRFFHRTIFVEYPASHQNAGRGTAGCLCLYQDDWFIHRSDVHLQPVFGNTQSNRKFRHAAAFPDFLINPEYRTRYSDDQSLPYGSRRHGNSNGGGAGNLRGVLFHLHRALRAVDYP